MTNGPLTRKKPMLLRRNRASQTTWHPSINIPESLKMDIMLRIGCTLRFWTVKLRSAWRWTMKILIASRVATIAFTANDTEKAAVPNGKNQFFAAPGTLNGGGSINAAIIAKEVPETLVEMEQCKGFEFSSPNDVHAKIKGILITSSCLPHISQHR